jgi:hypothetical protein
LYKQKCQLVNYPDPYALVLFAAKNQLSLHAVKQSAGKLQLLHDVVCGLLTSRALRRALQAAMAAFAQA